VKALQLRSEPLISSVLAITAGGETLRAGDPAERNKLIESVRAGKQLPLDVLATTFRQKDGTPNRRFLRFKPGALAAVAKSYVGMPLILDHNAWDQQARIGTITASELVQDAGGQAFRQTLNIVKPEAVISVLDGTIDRFSIGWSGTGPVHCTVHQLDVRGRGSCGCWPGDKVLVDGVSKTVEYEFQSAEGTEVSAVNVPAVKGTGISDVRAALAAERDRGLLVLPEHRRTSAPSRSPAPTRRPQLEALTASEREMCAQLGITEADYLANKRANQRTAPTVSPEQFAADIDRMADQLGFDDAMRAEAHALAGTRGRR
jgi:phage head maturation protease